MHTINYQLLEWPLHFDFNYVQPITQHYFSLTGSPFGTPQYIHCMHHGITFSLLHVPFIFAGNAMCQFAVARINGFPTFVPEIIRCDWIDFRSAFHTVHMISVHLQLLDPILQELNNHTIHSIDCPKFRKLKISWCSFR